MEDHEFENASSVEHIRMSEGLVTGLGLLQRSAKRERVDQISLGAEEGEEPLFGTHIRETIQDFKDAWKAAKRRSG